MAQIMNSFFFFFNTLYFILFFNLFLYFSCVPHPEPDHELFIAKFRLKLKKIGKTNRPFRYDQNQIPYDYTVEVTDSRD